MINAYSIPYYSEDDNKKFSGEIIIDIKNIKYLRSITHGSVTRYYMFLSETNLGVELSEENFRKLRGHFLANDL